MIYIRRDQRLLVVVAVVVFLLLIAAINNDHVRVSVKTKVPQWLKHSDSPDAELYQPHEEDYIPLPHANSPSNHHFDTTIANTTAETVIPRGAHAPGFTVFDQLYLRAGIFYVVTADPSSWPPRRLLVAKPVEMGGGHDSEPTDEVSRAYFETRSCSVLSTARICNLFIHRRPRKFWGNLRCGYLTFQSLCTTIGNL